MRLSWVFIVQTEVFPLKNIFEFDWLYTGRTGGSSGGKEFNNIFSNIFTVCSTWPGSSKVLSSITGRTFFSPLLFFSFSFCLDFFLVIAILFGFFIQLKIFRFINFLLYCLIFPFHRSSREVLRLTYFSLCRLFSVVHELRLQEYSKCSAYQTLLKIAHNKTTDQK